MNKILVSSILMSAVLTSSAFGCTNTSNYNRCNYNYHAVQPIYCCYCGNEGWQCSCNYNVLNNCGTIQPLYCGYCGNEGWQCECDYNYSNSDYYDDIYYEDCYYDYNEYYCESESYSGLIMAQWANMRDECGNLIGIANAGDSICIIGTCPCDSERTIIQNYTNGLYGSVLTSCIYGNYVWNGEYTCENDYSYENNYSCTNNYHDYNCDCICNNVCN